MVILGLDVGTIRVGIAVADGTVRIPFPVGVWLRAKYGAEKALLAEIENRPASLLVVGLPLGASGERTPACNMVEGFVRRIAKRVTIEIVYVDEAFSSLEATERLSQVSRGAQHIDAFAACLILERYFELNSSS